MEQEISKCKMKIQIKSDILNISLDTFVKAFVEDNAVFSWKKYHESKGDLNLDVGTWVKASNTFGMTREMRFFKPVNLPGETNLPLSPSTTDIYSNIVNANLNMLCPNLFITS